MGLFDVFTGGPSKEAANAQRLIAAQAKNENIGTIDRGLNTSLANLTQGYNTGAGAINQGYSDASGSLTNAGTFYDPLASLGTKYGGATTTALNALGVNGQPGMDAARSAFSASPAYEWNRDQGLEAINRRRNAGGMLDSGNADRDAQTFGAGLASNEYNTWMNNLLGFTNPELAATAGAATGRANIGTQQAGLATGRGAMLADLAQRYGTGQAGLNTGAANAKVGNTNTAANTYNQTYKQEADAEMAGSGALWSAGLGLANLGLKASGWGGFGAKS
jgi:hypothetical protein